MNWIVLNNEEQLNEIIQKSALNPQVIFKHSTRCSISSMAKNRLDKAIQPLDLPFYYLDLIAHRNLSNIVAEQFNVMHESPQILIIKNKDCVYSQTHGEISMDDIIENIQ